MNLIQQLEAEAIAEVKGKKNIPEFRPGDTLKVGVKVVEGERTRIQNFEGVCIASETFTGDGAEMALDIPLSEADKVARLISDLTGGRVQVDFGS